MNINVKCEKCGHSFEVDESLAGRHGRCKSCGHELSVPAAGFRLAPLPDAELGGHEPAPRSEAAETEISVADGPRQDRIKLAPHEDRAEQGYIPEEFVADRAPYALDQEFEPPPSAVPPSSPPPVLMEARAGWRHTVRALLQKLAKLEDVIYLALMLFWFIGATAFLFELKQLAWTMLGFLVICSILLLVLGGFEIFVNPFKESVLHGLAVVFVPFYVFYYSATRWKDMKRPFRKAMGAFLPLIVLIVLALLSRPIRDWFLHSSPPTASDTETSGKRG